VTTVQKQVLLDSPIFRGCPAAVCATPYTTKWEWPTSCIRIMALALSVGQANFTVAC